MQIELLGDDSILLTLQCYNTHTVCETLDR